jgi:monoamine oxidase
MYRPFDRGRLGGDSWRGRPIRVARDPCVGLAFFAVITRLPVAVPVSDPPLPPLRDQLTQHMPQGTLMKFEAVYDTPFWRAKGLNGQVVSENGPVKVTFDTSPANGSLGIMMGFIGGHDARVWEDRPASERRDAVLQNFANYFGNEALNPRQVVEFNWSTEVWNRGCPVAVLGPGTLIDFGSALRTPVGRVHWAGTETSTYWNGYMDGAVRSGERAAKEALAGL